MGLDIQNTVNMKTCCVKFIIVACLDADEWNRFLKNSLRQVLKVLFSLSHLSIHTNLAEMGVVY